MDELESLVNTHTTTWAVFLCLALGLMSGCAAQPGQGGSPSDSSPVAATASPPQHEDAFSTVDCLLPGQLRRLGTHVTYVTARRPIRTTAEDCAIRGGEYTASDRADYQTALKLWLDAAQEGDPEAQYYVGTIYEKGPKGTSDYALAAVWYQKAAEQGFSRAAMNLGRLYEQGLGVTRNPSEAFRWYAKASGMDESGLSMLMNNEEASGRIKHLEKTVAAKEQELADLRQAMNKANEELAQLRRQLQQRSSDADMERQKLMHLQKQYEALHKKLGDQAAQPDQESVTAHYQEEIAGLREELNRHQAALHSQDQEQTRLRQQIAALKNLAATQTHKIDVLEKGLTRKEEHVRELETELKRAQQDLSTFTAELQLRTKDAQEARSRLQATEARYARAQHDLEQAVRQRVSKTVIENYEQELRFLKTVLDDQRDKVESRETEVASLKQTVASLETALAARTQQLGAVKQEAKDQLHTLERTLKEREQEVARTREHLNTIRQQMAKLEAKLQEQTSAAQEKQDRLQYVEQQYRQRIVELEHALTQAHEQASNQAQEQLVALQAQLQRQQQIVENREEELSRLHQQIASLEKEAAQRAKELEAVPVVDLGFEGPTIEVIDPPLVLRRGIQVVKDTPTIPSKIGMPRHLSGRVIAPAGLRILTINGLTVQVDANGIFTMDLPPLQTGQDRLPVEILAIDVQNKRAATKLLLTAETTTVTKPLVSEEDLTVFGNYHALVIGNDRYQHWNPLKNAVADAQAVADILQNRYGFDVTFLKDATRRDILKALNSFRKHLKENDNLLVYYAGHGHLESDIDRGYWIPVDAEIDDTSQWILTPSITDLLELMSAKHVLVVADSCFAGKLTRSSLAKLRPGLSEDARMTMLKTIAKKHVRTALTSGGEHPVLDVGGKGHSVFTSAFLEVLRENQIILETERLFWAVRTRVVKAASRYDMEQIPTYWPIQFAGHESLGDFIFVPRASL